MCGLRALLSYCRERIKEGVIPEPLTTLICQAKLPKSNYRPGGLLGVAVVSVERGLLEGEAWFDVAHNAKRPFVVYAGDGAVRAVGILS